MDNAFFIRRCLEIAEGGRHLVGNGVLVGAVLVRDGEILEEGIHSSYGGVHAERELLQKYEQKISSKDILYTSLEPCCHQGKTPPCTDVIIERGIKNVVFGMVDPDPRMAGKGNAILREAGLQVIGPVLRAECEYFCRGFISVRTKNRPFITLKRALARDGSFANPNGSPKKITSEAQDIWAHSHLRFPADGIVCGIGTILFDDPELNTRFAQNKELQNQVLGPYRIILDPHLNLPEDAKVVSDPSRDRTIIITRPLDELSSDHQRKFLLFQDRGVRMMPCDLHGEAFDLAQLFALLITPRDGYHGLTNLLIEGGAKTWKFFRDAGVVDEEVTLLGKV